MNNRFSEALVLSLVLTVPGRADSRSDAHFSESYEATTHVLIAQTNESTNRLVEFTRNQDGKLVLRGNVPTGGKGTNGVNYFMGNIVAADALTSVNSVILTPDKTRLFVANAGDNSVSTFALASNGALSLLAVSPTHGVRPTSLAWQNGTLYVTHQMGKAQLGAYRVDATNGKLNQIGEYTVVQQDALSTQVSVSPSGKFLIVNGFAKTVTPPQPANELLAFPIRSDGTLGTAVVSVSAGAGPFGAQFGRGALANTYFVTEAVSATATSYRLAHSGSFKVASGPVSVTGQTAPCWVSVTPDNHFAYISSGSGVVSLFALGASGRLRLRDVNAAAEPATRPATSNSSVATDSWVSPDGKYFYQEYSGDDEIVGYSIGSNGALTKLTEQRVNTSSKVSLQGLVGT